MSFSTLRLGWALLLMAAIFQAGATAKTAGSSYASSAGIYNTLVASSDSPFDQFGSITVNLSRTGALTGKLSLGADVYPLKASLNSGTAHISISPKHTPITVSLALDPSAQTVTGSVSTALVTGSFSATRVPYSRSNTAPQTGRYTLLLYPAQADVNSQGFGSATMRVAPSGLATISGHSETGDPFTASAYIDGNAMLPLYALTKSTHHGILHGLVRFRSISGISDCDGTPVWSESSGGVSGQVALIGSAYSAYGQTGMVLPFAAVQQNSSLGFSQGGVAFASVPVTLSSTGLSSTSSLVSGLKLDLATGAYSGLVSGVGFTRHFFGVVFQAQGFGAGVLINGNNAESVLLEQPSVSDSTLPGGATTGTVTQSGTTVYLSGLTVTTGTLQIGSTDPVTGGTVLGTGDEGATLTIGGSDTGDGAGIVVIGSGSLTLSGTEISGRPTAFSPSTIIFSGSTFQTSITGLPTSNTGVVDLKLIFSVLASGSTNLPSIISILGTIQAADNSTELASIISALQAVQASGNVTDSAVGIAIESVTNPAPVNTDAASASLGVNADAACGNHASGFSEITLGVTYAPSAQTDSALAASLTTIINSTPASNYGTQNLSAANAAELASTIAATLQATGSSTNVSGSYGQSVTNLPVVATGTTAVISEVPVNDL